MFSVHHRPSAVPSMPSGPKQYQAVSFRAIFGCAAALLLLSAGAAQPAAALTANCQDVLDTWVECTTEQNAALNQCLTDAANARNSCMLGAIGGGLGGLGIGSCMGANSVAAGLTSCTNSDDPEGCILNFLLGMFQDGIGCAQAAIALEEEASIIASLPEAALILATQLAACKGAYEWSVDSCYTSFGGAVQGCEPVTCNPSMCRCYNSRNCRDGAQTGIYDCGHIEGGQIVDDNGNPVVNPDGSKIICQTYENMFDVSTSSDPRCNSGDLPSTQVTETPLTETFVMAYY